MRTLIAVLAVLAMVGCGQPDDGSEVHSASAMPTPDAGEVDAGPLADAGFDPCTQRTTLESCSAALVSIVACCSGADEYQAPPVATFCEHIEMGDANPAVACKDLSALPCADMISDGVCF